jgi:hypothetical protein
MPLAILWLGFSVGAVLTSWAFGAVFLWVALKIRGRAGRHMHRASVTHVAESDDRGYYFAMCDCGWIEPPVQSREEAFAAARRHSKRVDEDVAERVADAA